MGSEIHIKIKLKVIGKPKWRYRITEWILLLKNLPSHITKCSEGKIQGEIEKKLKNCYTTIQNQSKNDSENKRLKMKNRGYPLP